MTLVENGFFCRTGISISPFSSPSTSTCASCPQCNSTNLRREGKKLLKCGITQQRYLCKDCGKNFYFPPIGRGVRNLEHVEYFPCTRCGSSNVKNKGFKIQYKETKQVRQFKCRDCNRYFSIKLFCFVNEPLRQKTIRRPSSGKPRKRPLSIKRKAEIQMQTVKDNYVRQTVDSLDMPCFMCRDIIRCNPVECVKMESYITYGI